MEGMLRHVLNDSGEGAMAEETRQEDAKALMQTGKRLLAARRFADAWEVFDQALRKDKRDPRIHTLLGIASLYQEFLDDAREYFEKAIELDRDNADARCGLSYVMMRQDRVAEATEELCDVLRIHPRHVIAKKRFAELKKAESIDAWIAGLHPSMFVELPKSQREIRLPGWANASKSRQVAIWVMLVCMLVLLGFCAANGLYIQKRRGGTPGPQATDRYYPAAVPLDTDIGQRLQRAMRAAQKPEEVFLSDAEVSSLLTRAQALLRNGEYNEARHLVNKLLASNADRVSLDMAKRLDAFVKAPQADRLHYNPELDDVIEHGPLFKGVHVKWLTRVVRRTNQVFLQVAPALAHRKDDKSTRVVVLDRTAERYNPGATVEIFGEVVGVDTADQEDRVIFIEGKKMQRLERGIR